jgi:hypothetical protein
MRNSDDMTDDFLLSSLIKIKTLKIFFYNDVVLL